MTITENILAAHARKPVVALLKGVGEWVREQRIPPFTTRGSRGRS